MARQSALITVMAKAAYHAARGLKRDFGEVENLQVSSKGPSDFVSAADLQAERILREELTRARPEYGFLLEEGGAVAGSDPHRRWIVDPLDGTLNFLHGIPHFAISIALEKEGQIVAGVIYEPLRDELFWAEMGAGAFVNDHRLRVSTRGKMDVAVFATGVPWRGRPNHDVFLAQLKEIMSVSAGIRRFGSAALDLAYVSAGRFDGFWESSLNPWDIAAGVLLVREAGGFVTTIDGDRDAVHGSDILAVNDRLHGTLMAALARARNG